MIEMRTGTFLLSLCPLTWLLPLFILLLFIPQCATEVIKCRVIPSVTVATPNPSESNKEAVAREETQHMICPKIELPHGEKGHGKQVDIQLPELFNEGKIHLKLVVKHMPMPKILVRRHPGSNGLYEKEEEVKEAGDKRQRHFVEQPVAWTGEGNRRQWACSTSSSTGLRVSGAMASSTTPSTMPVPSCTSCSIYSWST